MLSNRVFRISFQNQNENFVYQLCTLYILILSKCRRLKKIFCRKRVTDFFLGNFFDHQILLKFLRTYKILQTFLKISVKKKFSS